MSNYTIKPIQSSNDLSQCASLLMQAYNAEPWNDNWTHDKANEKLNCFYNSPKFLGWMAYDGNTLVGACVGNIEPYFTGDYFYLKELFVLPHNQHSGIGSQLMNNLKEELKKINIETVILFTSNESFPYQFYLKHGFGDMDGMRMMTFGATE